MKYLLGFIVVFKVFASLSADSLAESKEALQSKPVYEYPYSNLESELEREGKATLLIYSYGSLLDSASAERTFGEKALATRRLAIAVGTQRTFNRDVPLKPGQRWGLPCDDQARGMLNVVLTGSDRDLTNGISMEVPIEDISAMRNREEGYDLVPVVIAWWCDYLTEKNPDYKIAYTFHARDATEFTSDNIYPRPGYYELTRDAAKRQGPLFYKMWMSSTYFSDKKTPITVWEEAVRTCHEATLIIQQKCLCP
jgi:hypothetical protein